ncbi:MAG: PleD family two-component response regulator [Alteromonadaceae bacterium]|jgi:PleD family two-component response regulator
MLKVMIVDDAKMSLNIVVSILEKESSLDIDIHSFLDSNKAKDNFLSIKPDLVITDIFMPDVDGFELIKYVKLNSDTPVLAISSEKFGSGSLDSILKMAKSRGADYVLSKTSLIEDLPALVKNIFN